MSNYRESSSEPGLLISKRLLDQMLGDIAFCKQQTGIRPVTQQKLKSNDIPVAARLPWLITAATVIETNFWRYSAKLMKPVDAEGSNRGYVDDPSNVTTEHMYNEAEFGNGSVRKFTIAGNDAYGSGIVRSDVPTGFAIQPVPINRIVWALRVIVKRGGAWADELRFCEPNGISGTVNCEPADLFAPDLFQ